MSTPPTLNPRPDGAIAGWSARGILDPAQVPVLTPTGRHKRTNGALQYRPELKVSLFHDRQDRFGPEAVQAVLVGGVVPVVLSLVNRGINELESVADINLGGGLTATYRASAGYVSIAVIVPGDDAGWEAGKWSNTTLPIPAPGDRVFVRMNRFGVGTVVRRFMESGHIGVVVIPDARPDWHIKQNPTRPVCMVFGAEIRPLDAADKPVLIADEASVISDKAARQITGVTP